MRVKDHQGKGNSKYRYLFLVSLIICTIFFPASQFTKSIVGEQNLYLVKPILWLITGVSVWRFPAVHPRGKLRFKGLTTTWALTFSFIIIGAQILAGLIDGFGKSPYNHSLEGILVNALSLGSALVGREMLRSYFVNGIVKRENNLFSVIVALVLTEVTFPLHNYGQFNTFQDFVIFVARFYGPEFSRNLLANYLAYLGGPLPSMIFMGVAELFQWFSPVLPDLKWITAALVGILTPVFLIPVLQNIYELDARIRKRHEKPGLAGWMATTLFSVAVVWFAAGVFPIYPSVIATGSMEPLIKPGDVTIVNKSVDIGKLHTGDIIQYRKDNILISHRIIEVVKEEGKLSSFRTKGDNNTIADLALVKPEQVKGQVIGTIPKLGWPTLLIKSNNTVPREKVEF